MWEQQLLVQSTCTPGKQQFQPPSQDWSFTLYLITNMNFLYVWPLGRQPQTVDELLVFDMFYILSYMLMSMYYYILEYKDRCEFYDKAAQVAFYHNYKKILDFMPNGIILLDKANMPVFYNSVVAKIIARRSGRNSQRSFALDEKKPNLEEDRKRLLDAMADVVQVENKKNLKDIIADWKGEEREDKNKYIYKTDEEETVFTVKLLKTKFQGKGRKTIILQDVSAYHKLVQLDEKYQKLYVASIVHDIRTPLNGIMGMLEMLKGTHKTKEEEVYLSVAMKTCKLLLFLTHDITDYSQLEANKFKANNAKVNVKALLDETLQLLTFNFEKKRIQLFSEISEITPKYVYIDKNRYMQILLNLLGNALKFTFKGHVKISVDYDSYNDILITSVRDTGIGIKEEELPRLFKLFGKLESSEMHNPQGVGFGLAICKRLSESLGGYISVASKVGLGSTFTFGIKASLGSVSMHESSLSACSGTSSLVVPGGIDTLVRKHNSTFKPKVVVDPLLYSQVVLFIAIFFSLKQDWRRKEQMKNRSCVQRLKPVKRPREKHRSLLLKQETLKFQ
eukprot:TRINITY_DN3085_c0_g1_i4.p1 TRINITY_DN3085_c0_g1~~TRINITY_DN3085_c0_g1_i4.p1  ORF type:complete len:563 (+),score=60.44 TRINITY_DN3085_c0_g1_i4:1464-3152(+)